MDRPDLPSATRWIVRILRPFLMVVTRRDWRGAEKLPTDGGFVLAPNHISHLDPILISHFMVDHGVTPRFLAKDTLFSVKGTQKAHKHFHLNFCAREERLAHRIAHQLPLISLFCTKRCLGRFQQTLNNKHSFKKF